MGADEDSLLAQFVEAACAPYHGHSDGSLDQAEALLAAHPELRGRGIQVAAILGDAIAVRRELERDPASATAKGLRGWDPLTSLCFSRYLKLDPDGRGFVEAATALLDAGASPATGFQQDDEYESVLYGAAGVAHHPELTRLLLDRGADPNDEEVPYHSPESYDNRALKVLVESGRMTPDSLTTMLLRKHDWHDGEGARWLLEHGADPNRRTRWRTTAFEQALQRDNALETVAASLDHGADPTVAGPEGSAIQIAARRGRRDVLELLDQRGVPLELQGMDLLLAACARDDGAALRAIAGREPGLVRELVAGGGRSLVEFAGVGNTEGVRNLLDLGVPVAAPFLEGDPYWDLAANSTALHAAAWRGRHATVAMLIERDAPIEALDARGRTPLALALRACVDSYWMGRRTTESIRALLEAGASTRGLALPSGYAEADALLSRHGAER